MLSIGGEGVDIQTDADKNNTTFAQYGWHTDKTKTGEHTIQGSWHGSMIRNDSKSTFKWTLWASQHCDNINIIITIIITVILQAPLHWCIF